MAMSTDETRTEGAVLHDRRRPGRRDVDPALIPLLRGQGPVVRDDAPDEAAAIVLPARDDLGAAVGIARGVAAMGVVYAVGIAAYILF